MVVVLLLTVLPAMVWAQAPSNEELYQMIEKMERKLEAAIDEANKAKEELARIKGGPAAAPETAPAETLVRVPETKAGMEVSVEALYMRPSRSNLDFVVQDPYRTGNIRGNYVSVEPDYDWGVRAALNYNFGSGADIGVKFTQLDAEERKSISRGDSDLWGTWLHPNAVIDDNDVTDATANYDFEYGVIDFGVGQWVNAGKHLGLRFEAGLRHAEIGQELDIRYIQQVTPVLSRRVNVDQTNDFSGWGPRLGLGLDWKIARGFSIFGSVAGSFLMGDLDMTLKEDDWQVAAVNATRRVEVKETIDCHTVPVIEARAGIGYAFQKNSRIYGATMGYEWQNWFNMVAVKRGADDVDSQLMDSDMADLGLYGFFLEGFVSF